MSSSQHSPSIGEHILNSSEECKCWLHRLATYGEWPHLGRLSACTFTAAGFFYVGRGDEVTCASCRLSLGRWTSGMHPVTAHRALLSDACKFVSRRVLSSDLLHDLAGRSDVRQLLCRPNRQLTVSEQEAGGSSNDDRSGSRSSASDERKAASVGGTAASQPDGALVAGFGKAFVDLPLPPPISLIGLLRIPTVTGLDIGSLPPSRGASQRQWLPPLPIAREEALKYESYRLNTFVGIWECSSIVDPRELAQAGFYYCGPRDRVQCAFCQGLLRNWEPGDRAMALHAQHFTYCRFVQGHEVGNVPIPFSALEQKWPACEGAVGEEVLGISRSTPQHSDLAVEARRLATFATWPPAHELKPDDLAKAGFFYVGGQSSVKCFYCDVLISVWPTGSNAWVEHAKHASSCVFLEQVKGMDFVQQHRVTGSRADGSSPQARFTVDPREIRARLDAPKVQILLRMEYPVDLVREAVQKRLSTGGDDHVSSEDLLASMFDIHDQRQRMQLEDIGVRPSIPVALPLIVTPVIIPSAPNSTASALIHSSSVPALPTNADRSELRYLSAAARATSLGSIPRPELFPNAELQQPAQLPLAGTGQHVFEPATWKPRSAEEENRQLKTQLACKICMDSLVGIVFLPCGHFVCCPACAPALTTCPICRVSIRGTVRTCI